mgnify:CR=1 FL=1
MVLERLEIQAVLTDEISAPLSAVQQAFKKLDSTTKIVADELQSRLDNVTSTMVEFGASTDQVNQAIEALKKTSGAGSRGLAQQANVLRTLVDESEDADAAMRNMSRAFELAAATGEKAEDAGRKLGRLLKGDTSVLRDFDAEARRVADALDKIQDPTKRAALAQRELTKALRRQSSALGKAKDELASLDVELAKVGLSAKSIAGGIVALGAAMAGATLVNIKNFAEANKEVGEQLDSSAKAIKRASEAVGEAQLNILGGSENISNFGLVTEGLTDDLIALREEYIGFIKISPDLVRGVAEVASEYLGLDSALNLVNDATRTNRLGTIEQINLHKEHLRAVRALRIEEEERAKQAKAEELRKAQVRSGQLIIDPLTGAETLLAGPAPFAGPFSPAGRGAPRGGGGGRAQSRAPTAAELLAFGPTSAELGMTGQQALAGLGGSSIPPSLMMDMGMRAMGPLDLGSQLRANLETVDQTTTALDSLDQQGISTNKVFTDLANGGIALAAQGISGFVENLVAGEASLASFGLALLSSIGDLLNQAGQAFILLGAGVDNIDKGIFSPGALIAIGVGMLALGGAMKGFAARGQGGGGGGGGGQTAQALERFGRRLFDREVGQESREVTINIEGRSMRGFVLDVAADGARRGQLAPVTPRRP